MLTTYSRIIDSTSIRESSLISTQPTTRPPSSTQHTHRLPSLIQSQRDNKGQSHEVRYRDTTGQGIYKVTSRDKPRYTRYVCVYVGSISRVYSRTDLVHICACMFFNVFLHAALRHPANPVFGQVFGSPGGTLLYKIAWSERMYS